MKIKCLIFDCDGLMFNTEYHAQATWTHVMNKHNIPIPEGFFDAITGAGEHQFREVMQHHPEIEVCMPEISKNRIPDLKAALEQYGNVNKPGLIKLLNYLKTTDLKVCVASSSKTEYVKWMISTIGTEFAFDVILGGDQVAKGKPNPDIFLKAAALANIAPEHCLVLEDSKNGHLAAKAAGMHRVFIEDLVQPDQQMTQELIEFQCASLEQVIDLLEDLNK